MISVITPYFNPKNSDIRRNLYENFKCHMKEYGVKLYTIEISYDGIFQVTNKKDKFHIQVESKDIMWHKENMINVVIEKLPKKTKYVAWFDNDIEFTDQNWLTNSLLKLETSSCVLQPYSISNWLDENGNYERSSLSYSFENKHVYEPMQPSVELFRFNQHVKKMSQTFMSSPGLAWISSMDFMKSIGGMFMPVFFRSGDLIMANAFYNKPFPSFYIIEGLKNEYDNYQTKIRKYMKETNKFPSYVEGQLIHHYHGPVTQRKNFDHFQLLKQYNINPNSAIQKNKYGIYEFTDNISEDFKSKLSSMI